MSEEITKDELEKQCFELLVNEALNYTEIAEKLEVTRTRVVSMVTRVLTSIKAEELEVREYRIIASRRFDYWLSCLADKIKEGDAEAIRTATRVEERRAKMLGLDKPTKIDITHRTQSKDPDAAAKAQRERLNRHGFLKMSTKPPIGLLPAPKEGQVINAPDKVAVEPEPERPSDDVDLGAAG